jgi:hypothetical protein
MDLIGGSATAPAQYRIGVVDTAWFLARHAHVGLRHTFTLIDVVAGFIAIFTLFYLLRRSAVYQNASVERQWFGAAAFVVLVEFYLAWLLWYQRPETLTTAAILALALLLLKEKLPLPTLAGTTLSAAGLLLLAGAQGFVRADVALALHAGVFLVCLTRTGEGFALPRRVQAGTSFGAVLVALGTQYYLMRVAFPHATYGDTPVFQLLLNLHPGIGWVAFLTFVAPFIWTLTVLARTGWQAEAPALGALAGSIIFFGMWWTVGRIEEVRIFMPFALMLMPLTAGLAMQEFLPVGTTTPQSDSRPRSLLSR